MKIIRIMDGYSYPGDIGPNIFVHVLSRELAKRAHQTTIFNTTPKGKNRHTEKMDGYTIKNYKPFFRIWTFPLSLRLMSDVVRENADIIHVHGYRSIHSELAAWISAIKKTPYVLSPHGSLLGYNLMSYKYAIATGLIRALHILYDTVTFKFALRNASCIAVCSKQEAEDALKIGVPQRKIKVMHHAEDISNLHTTLDLKYSTHKVLAVGRIDITQNLDTLLKAFAIVLEQISDAELLIVGSASGTPRTVLASSKEYCQMLRKLCDELGIVDKVEFTGPLYGEDLKDAFVSSDVYIYVGPFGNYGRVHIEAAAFGKPIISTRVGIAPDLVGNDEGGFLVNPYDIGGIAQAIVTLLSDTKVYQAKQKAIMRRVKKFLDVKRMVDEYEELYKQLSSH